MLIFQVHDQYLWVGDGGWPSHASSSSSSSSSPEPLVDSRLFAPYFESQAPLGQWSPQENYAAAATSGSDSKIATSDADHLYNDRDISEWVSGLPSAELLTVYEEILSVDGFEDQVDNVLIAAIARDHLDASCSGQLTDSETTTDSSQFDLHLDNDQLEAINAWVSGIPSGDLFTLYEEIFNGVEDEVDSIFNAAVARDHPDARLSCSGELTHSAMGLNIYGVMTSKHLEMGTSELLHDDQSQEMRQELLQPDFALAEAEMDRQMVYATPDTCSRDYSTVTTLFLEEDVDWRYEKEIISSRMLGKRSQRNRMIEAQLQEVVQDFENYWKKEVPSDGGPREERSLRSFQREITLIMNAYCTREKRRVRYLPDFCIQVLSEWVGTDDHQQNPYPEKYEIRRLAKEVGLTCNQVKQWFENYRSRDWKGHQSGIRKGKFFRFGTETTDIVKKWMIDHKDDPNPRGRHLKNLVERTSMTSEEVKQWCYNFRRRHKNELQ